jgi:hypothetical protein
MTTTKTQRSDPLHLLHVHNDEDLKVEEIDHDESALMPSNDSSHGKTSVVQTVLNLMKTCMGSGEQKSSLS